MDQQDLYIYKDLIERLLFLESVQQVRYTLRNTPNLDGVLLTTALQIAIAEAQKTGETGQETLLNFLLEIVEDEFEPDESWQGAAATFEELIQRALRLNSALECYFLLRDHRHLLSPESYSDVLLTQVEENIRRPSGQAVITLYVIARLQGNLAKIGEATLIWASNCRRDGYFGHAIRHLERTQELAQRAQDEEMERKAAILQSTILEDLGNTLEAAEIQSEIYIKAHQEGDEVTAFSIAFSLAGLYRTLGRYSDALNIIVELQENPPDFAQSFHLNKLATMHGLLLEDLHRYVEAEAAYEKSLSWARAAGDQQLEFVALNNLATNYLKRDSPREAVRRFREILRFTQKQGNPVQIASSRNNLGHALMELDRPAEARSEYTKAWGVKMMAEAKDGEVIAALGAGDASRDLGDEERAATFYTLALLPALELYLRQGETFPLMSYAMRANNIDLHQDDDTIGMIADLHDGFRRRGDIRNEMFLTPIVADHLIETGDRALAVKLYRDTIKRGKELDARSPMTLDMQGKLADLLADEQGREQEAYDLLAEIISDIDIQMRGVLLDEGRSQIIDQWIAVYGSLISLLIEKGEKLDLPAGRTPGEIAFDFHEAAKSRTFIAGLADAPLAIPPGVPGELIEQEARLLVLEGELQALVPQEGGEAARRRLERLRQVQNELQACWEEMARYDPEYVRMRSAMPITLPELQRLLGDDANANMAFVSFFVDQNVTTIFVVRPNDDQPRLYRSAIGRAELETAVQRIQRAFNGDPDDFPPYPPIRRERPQARSLDFLDKLSAKLLEFLPAVEGCELLCISAHGPLHLLPLHALRAPDGRYLLEHFALCYTPSATTLRYVLPRTTGGSGAANGARAYVAGVASGEDTHPEYFENDGIIFDERYWQVEVDSGPARVTPRNVIRSLEERFDVIHLTCHGFFNRSRPLSSGLLLADGRDRPPRRPQNIPIGDRSSFLLTAGDLLRTRIHAPLVVLRACSTALQSVRNQGDEFEGLSRSMLYAGGESLLVSLWNVDQRSSQQLLAKFYDEWAKQDRKEKWRALWAAQKEFLNAPPEPFLNHPYHWAPILLVGNWR